MTVVVGVDGAGRTYRLGAIAVAAGVPIVRIEPPVDDVADIATQIGEARSAGALLTVDDAHQLTSDALRLLATAARSGQRIAIARRPTIDRPELAELDEAVAAGGVEHLRPLDVAGVTALLAETLGDQPAARAAAVHAASAGMPTIAAALAMTADESAGEIAGGTPPALLARVQRQLARLDDAAGRVARVLALRLAVSDEVSARAATVPGDEFATVIRTLRDAGMLVPDADEMIPAVADALIADLPPAQRRRVHNDVATALLEVGADPLITATHLRAARVVTPIAAGVYRMAGEQLRFADPEAALAWYADAADAGADPGSLLAGRAEAAASLGRPTDPGAADPSSADAMRLALVAGAVEGHDGRAARAADALLSAGPLGRMLAVPSLVAVGRLDEAKAAADGDAPRAIQRFAEAALATENPVSALPLFIEAADAVEYARPPVVLADTPHALGALLAVTAGDASTAEHLLERAIIGQVGGPVAGDRHRLLLAWVRLRSGRYDTARAELARLAGRASNGRDRMLLAALTAGLARRSGDIAQLRDALATVEQVLARRVVDLFHVEVVEELVAAAARLGQPARAATVLDALGEIITRLGRSAAWATALSWAKLQAAISAEDAELSRSVAEEMGSYADSGGVGGVRPRAQQAAAQCWADGLAGDVIVGSVLEVAEKLRAAGLPWEASRLAGQAAIRTADAVAARRLLERARDLMHADSAAHAQGRPSDVLSERETEISRLVLAGRTHREIGAQLYISPKTVEHHVARIRTKLGVSTRAEFVAALREVLSQREQGE